MPLYEYVCQECGNHFDTLRSMKDADKPIECRACHSDKTTRALSMFYASSEGRSVTSSGGGCGCGSCGGGSCGSCGSHN